MMWVTFSTKRSVCPWIKARPSSVRVTWARRRSDWLGWRCNSPFFSRELRAEVTWARLTPSSALI